MIKANLKTYKNYNLVREEIFCNANMQDFKRELFNTAKIRFDYTGKSPAWITEVLLVVGSCKINHAVELSLTIL